MIGCRRQIEVVAPFDGGTVLLFVSHLLRTTMCTRVGGGRDNYTAVSCTTTIERSKIYYKTVAAIFSDEALHRANTQPSFLFSSAQRISIVTPHRVARRAEAIRILAGFSARSVGVRAVP